MRLMNYCGENDALNGDDCFEVADVLTKLIHLCVRIEVRILNKWNVMFRQLNVLPSI